MVDAELGHRIDDGVDQSRRGADRPGLAGALYAKRVGLARHDIVGKFERRQVFDHAGPYETAAALETDIRRYVLR